MLRFDWWRNNEICSTELEIPFKYNEEKDPSFQECKDKKGQAEKGRDNHVNAESTTIRLLCNPLRCKISP